MKLLIFCWFYKVVDLVATPGYEIPAHLYSLLKSTRTLIAKAIGQE